MRTLSLLTILLAIVVCAGCLAEPEPITDDTEQQLGAGEEACITTYMAELRACNKAYDDDAAWEPAKDTESTRKIKAMYLTYLQGVRERCGLRAQTKMQACIAALESDDTDDAADDLSDASLDASVDAPVDQ